MCFTPRRVPKSDDFNDNARKTVHWSEEQPQVFAVLNWQRRASETEEEAATERPFPQLLAELFGSWRCGFGG